MIDAPPDGPSSPPYPAVEVPPPSAQNIPQNHFKAWAIRDSQYDDYDDFRNQRRHLDRPLYRSAVTDDTNDPFVTGDYSAWPTSR
jgi:hypothetical protein